MKKTKIKVRPEGRENIWLPERESLVAYIKVKRLKKIHNFILSGMMMIGADHDVESVIDDIARADRLAVFTDPHANMGYSLAVITKEKLECFDIGPLTENELDITL